MAEADSIQARKAELRSLAGTRRNVIVGRPERSAAICARVIALPQFRDASAIHCFLPIRSEVDTRPIIAAALAAGKAVAIPITVGKGPLEHSWISTLEPMAFTQGSFGTLRPLQIRPATPGMWSLTIVPLLAFDRMGTRLGYGKGHYDRLLAQTGSAAIGVAFADQELPELPSAGHDVSLDLIVTEQALISRQ